MCDDEWDDDAEFAEGEEGESDDDSYTCMACGELCFRSEGAVCEACGFDHESGDDPVEYLYGPGEEGHGCPFCGGESGTNDSYECTQCGQDFSDYYDVR